jgi:hypothetical protein
VVSEPESEALQSELSRWDEWISASIAQAEVVRACRLAAARGLPGVVGQQLVHRAESVVAGIAMLDVDMRLMREAGTTDPVFLGTVDAIHLAALRSLGADVGAVFTYNDLLATAARQLNLTVLSPA